MPVITKVMQNLIECLDSAWRVQFKTLRLSLALVKTGCQTFWLSTSCNNCQQSTNERHYYVLSESRRKLYVMDDHSRLNPGDRQSVCTLYENRTNFPSRVKIKLEPIGTPSFTHLPTVSTLQYFKKHYIAVKIALLTGRPRRVFQQRLSMLPLHFRSPSDRLEVFNRVEVLVYGMDGAGHGLDEEDLVDDVADDAQETDAQADHVYR